jgi:hypothetical protein
MWGFFIWDKTKLGWQGMTEHTMVANLKWNLDGR